MHEPPDRQTHTRQTHSRQTEYPQTEYRRPGDSVSNARIALLAIGLLVLVLGLFAGAGVLVRQTDDSAEPVAVQATPTPAEVVRSRNPRREPDLDVGTPVEQGVFVQIARGWTKQTYDHLGIRITSHQRGAEARFYVVTNPVTSLPLLRPDVDAFAETQDLRDVRYGRAVSVPPPNLNVVEAARISFTGRRTEDDAVYSLAGECLRLRGAPTINDVSVSICFAAYVQDLDTVRAEVRRMTGSVARSI